MWKRLECDDMSGYTIRMLCVCVCALLHTVSYRKGHSILNASRIGKWFYLLRSTMLSSCCISFDRPDLMHAPNYTAHETKRKKKKSNSFIPVDFGDCRSLRARINTQIIYASHYYLFDFSICWSVRVGAGHRCRLQWAAWPLKTTYDSVIDRYGNVYFMNACTDLVQIRETTKRFSVAARSRFGLTHTHSIRTFGLRMRLIRELRKLRRRRRNKNIALVELVVCSWCMLVALERIFVIFLLFFRHTTYLGVAFISLCVCAGINEKKKEETEWISNAI